MVDGVASRVPHTRAPSLPTSVADDRLTRWAAGLIALTLPLRAVFPYASSLVSIGLVIAFVLLPVIAASVTRYRYTVPIIGLMAASVASAPFLMSATDRQVDGRIALLQILTLVFSAVSLLALLWARSQLGIERLAIWYSIGLAVQKLLTLDTVESLQLNTWKYALSVPMTIFLLAVAAAFSRSWPTVLVLTLMALLSIQSGYRSFFAITIITLGAYLWVRKSPRPDRAPGRSDNSFAKTSLALVSLVAMIVIVYRVSIWLALNGFLGERNAVVTRLQAARGDSILAAGRAENAAAWRLFAERPLGYGPGAVADAADVAAGESGLAARGVRLDSSVVDEYVFGQGAIKLHSVISDLWVQFGLVGLALGVTLLVVAGKSLMSSLFSATTTALLLFLATSCIWNLLFSPLLSNLGDVIFAIAMLLPAKDFTDAGRRTRIESQPEAD